MRIRPAEREDAELLFGLIRELADYEKLSEAVRGSAELLATALFDNDGVEALIAEVDEGLLATACSSRRSQPSSAGPGSGSRICSSNPHSAAGA